MEARNNRLNLKDKPKRPKGFKAIPKSNPKKFNNSNKNLEIFSKISEKKSIVSIDKFVYKIIAVKFDKRRKVVPLKTKFSNYLTILNHENRLLNIGHICPKPFEDIQKLFFVRKFNNNIINIVVPNNFQHKDLR